MIPKRVYDLLPNLHEGVYVVDDQRKIVFWNKGAERISGYSEEDVVGKYCYDNILKHIDEKGKELCFGGCPLHRAMKANKILDGRVYLHHKLGHRVEVKVRAIPIIENDVVVGALEAFTDQSFQEDYFQQNQELVKRISYDHLMGIYNREYLDMYLKHWIEEAKMMEKTFGLLFIDVDKFKEVNDTYGHQVGDEVLKLIARTLSGNLRAKDIIGRYGGDELMILLDVETKEVLKNVADKLRILVHKSNYKAIQPSITIGGALFEPEDDKESITSRADKALFKAKNQGRNCLVIGE